MADRGSLPGWPRGLSRGLAAAYVGISPGLFRQLEERGCFRAVWLTKRRKVYLREHLDAYLDRASGEPSDPLPGEDEPETPDWQKALQADGQGVAPLS